MEYSIRRYIYTIENDTQNRQGQLKREREREREQYFVVIWIIFDKYTVVISRELIPTPFFLHSHFFLVFYQKKYIHLQH